MKATGVGPREQGTAALEFFTEIKTVYVDYTGQARKGEAVLSARAALAAGAGSPRARRRRRRRSPSGDGSRHPHRARHLRRREHAAPARLDALLRVHLVAARASLPRPGYQAGREASDALARQAGGAGGGCAARHPARRARPRDPGRRPAAVHRLQRRPRGDGDHAGTGRRSRPKVEPPHRDLLAPGADKSTMVMARSLDLRGESITGTRREVCLLSYTLAGRVRGHARRPGGQGGVPAMTIFRDEGRADEAAAADTCGGGAEGKAADAAGHGLQELPRPLPQARRRLHRHRGLHDAHRAGRDPALPDGLRDAWPRRRRKVVRKTGGELVKVEGDSLLIRYDDINVACRGVVELEGARAAAEPRPARERAAPLQLRHRLRRRPGPRRGHVRAGGEPRLQARGGPGRAGRGPAHARRRRRRSTPPP